MHNKSTTKKKLIDAIFLVSRTLTNYWRLLKQQLWFREGKMRENDNINFPFRRGFLFLLHGGIEKTRSQLSREQIRELGDVGLRHLEGLVLGELYRDKKRKLVKQEQTLFKDLRN